VKDPKSPPSYDAPEDAVTLLLDARIGVFIPQDFIKMYGDTWSGIEDDDKKILLEGPDREDYWDVWLKVEKDAFLMKGQYKYTLHHDGDLFAICEELMLDEAYREFFGCERE
jgi:hypothetical protein